MQASPEARKAAEAMLGRQLLSGEIVHHINGSCLNNDPSNLLVCESEWHHKLAHQHLSLALKMKGGDFEEVRRLEKLDRWIKTKVSVEDHKQLKLLTIDKGISLMQLLREIIENFLHKEK